MKPRPGLHKCRQRGHEPPTKGRCLACKRHRQAGYRAAGPVVPNLPAMHMYRIDRLLWRLTTSTGYTMAIGTRVELRPRLEAHARQGREIIWHHQ